MEGIRTFWNGPQSPEEKLARLISSHGLQHSSPPLDDAFFDQMSTEMNAVGMLKEWTHRPRTYFILFQIKRIPLMSLFISYGLDDTSIPYKNRDALPKSESQRLTPFEAEDFLNWQKICVSDRLQLEHGKHIRLDDGDILFEDNRPKLGTGSEMMTIVDRVTTRATGRVFARKRIKRRKVPPEAQRNFSRELRALTKIGTHHHLIRVCGTYTDKKYLVLLLEPVADYTLKGYLSLIRVPDNTESQLLWSFYGCMAKVMSFLHDHESILHKDIKSDNFLLKGNQLILTDFGTSFDFSETGHSMTLANRRDAMSLRYASPEVVKEGTFHRASDIWSLGVVFLEMATILHNKTLKEFDVYLTRNGNGITHIHSNRDAALTWSHELRDQGCPPADNEPLAWIRTMLELSHTSRPTASDLYLLVSSSQNGRFCGSCCLDAPEESESESDSDLLLTDDEDTARPPQGPTSNITSENDSLNRTAHLPGAFPTDVVFQEYDQPVFAEPVATFERSMSSNNMLPPDESTRSENKSTNSPTDSSKQQTVVRKGSSMTGVKLFFQRPKKSRSPQRPMIPMRWTSRTRNDNDPFAMSLTIQGQRMNHYLTNLPAKNEFDEIIENHSDQERLTTIKSAVKTPYQLVDDPARSRSVGDKENHRSTDLSPRSSRPGPTRVRSLEGLQPTWKKHQYRNEETTDFFVRPLVRYPSDNDLQRQHRSSSNQIVECLEEMKRFRDSFSIPSSLQLRGDSNGVILDVLKEIEDIDSKTGPAVSGDEIYEVGNNPRLFIARCPQTFVRPDDAGPKLNNSHVNQSRCPSRAEKQVTFSDDDVKTPVQSEPEVPEQPDLVVPEIPGSANHFNGDQHSRVFANDVSQSMLNFPSKKKPNGESTGARLQPLRSHSSGSHHHRPKQASEFSTLSAHLAMVPESKKTTKREWESATTIMQRILDDKASIAPTSVLSLNTRKLLSGNQPLMRWNDAFYGYLPYFVSQGKVGAVRMLLDGGCNPGRLEKPRWLPVYNAIIGRTERHNKCLMALLNHGADVTAKHLMSGKTYLHFAIAQERWSGYSTTIYILLMAKANPNARDKVGETPLLSLLTGAGKLGQQERDALLLLLAPNFHTKVHLRDPNLHENVLHLAIRRQDATALDAILLAIKNSRMKKEMLKERNASGYTPLLLVVNTCSFASDDSAANATRMMELLLERGASPNDADETTADTALHAIISVHQSMDAFELLLKHDADPNLLNKRKESAQMLLRAKASQEKSDSWYQAAKRKVKYLPAWQLPTSTTCSLMKDFVGSNDR